MTLKSFSLSIKDGTIEVSGTPYVPKEVLSLAGRIVREVEMGRA